LDLIEDFIKSVTREIQSTCPTVIEFFQKYIEPDLQQRYAAILDGKFERVDFAEVIEILKKSGQKFENQPEWGEDLFIEHERYLVDEYFKKPVLVTNYPENFKSFYMRLNEDGRSVACVDLLLPGIGEVVGGSQREERYDYLKKRMEQKKMDPKLYEWYLETRRWGSAPHSGFGLGFERLVMYLTGMKNVKDVIPYPRAARKIY
jgi:asparaginyl-tRNA synthetase